MKLHIENFTVNLTNQQRNPLMATAILKAMESASQSSGLVLPRLGQVWDEQRGVYLGMMRGTDGAGDYALILPLASDADLGQRAWGERDLDIPEAKSDTDGSANTIAMANAGNALAKEIQSVEADGFGDLYLPARHEARLAYLMAADRFDKNLWYWTSTQSSAYYAWAQYFDDGTQDGNNKTYEGAVRLVRRFFL